MLASSTIVDYGVSASQAGFDMLYGLISGGVFSYLVVVLLITGVVYIGVRFIRSMFGME